MQAKHCIFSRMQNTGEDERMQLVFTVNDITVLFTERGKGGGWSRTKVSKTRKYLHLCPGSRSVTGINPWWKKTESNKQLLASNSATLIRCLSLHKREMSKSGKRQQVVSVWQQAVCILCPFGVGGWESTQAGFVKYRPTTVKRHWRCLQLLQLWPPC